MVDQLCMYIYTNARHMHKRCALATACALLWSLARVRVRGRDRAGHSTSRLKYERDSEQRAKNRYCRNEIGTCTVGQSGNSLVMVLPSHSGLHLKQHQLSLEQDMTMYLRMQSHDMTVFCHYIVNVLCCCSVIKYRALAARIAEASGSHTKLYTVPSTTTLYCMCHHLQ